LKSETVELKAAVKDLKLQNLQQDEEILLLKSQVSNPGPLLPLTPKLASNGAPNISYNKNFGPYLIHTFINRFRRSTIFLSKIEG